MNSFINDVSIIKCEIDELLNSQSNEEIVELCAVQSSLLESSFGSVLVSLLDGASLLEMSSNSSLISYKDMLFQIDYSIYNGCAMSHVDFVIHKFSSPILAGLVN